MTSPISVALAEGPETRGDKKRKQLVKAPTTVISIEEESSGSPLVQRRKRGTEGAEGDATLIPQAHASPVRSGIPHQHLRLNGFLDLQGAPSLGFLHHALQHVVGTLQGLIVALKRLLLVCLLYTSPSPRD